MKPREPRKKVMISARMRCGASWSDACILNFSSRGMLVQAPTAPSRGSYLEIRRGAHVIVARVVWTSANRFGVWTQDEVQAATLAGDPVSASARPDQAVFVERRGSVRRTRSRHEASRWAARSMEFAAVALLGALAAGFALSAFSQSVARPLAAVGLTLRR